MVLLNLPMQKKPTLMNLISSVFPKKVPKPYMFN